MENTEKVPSTFIDKMTRAWNNFDKPLEWFVFLAFYAAAGFIFGFLVKNFGKLIITLALLIAVILWLAQTTNILSVNYGALRESLGIAHDFTISQMISNIGLWIETHVVETIVASIGFIFGWIIT